MKIIILIIILDAWNTQEKKLWTHKIPTRKTFVNFCNQKGTMTRWHETHKIHNGTEPTEFSTLTNKKNNQDTSTRTNINTVSKPNCVRRSICNFNSKIPDRLIYDSDKNISPKGKRHPKSDNCRKLLSLFWSLFSKIHLCRETRNKTVSQANSEDLSISRSFIWS